LTISELGEVSESAPVFVLFQAVQLEFLVARNCPGAGVGLGSYSTLFMLEMVASQGLMCYSWFLLHDCSGLAQEARNRVGA